MTRRRSAGILAIISLAAAVLTMVAVVRMSLDTTITSLATEKTVEIPPRTTTGEIAGLLKNAGIMPDRLMFTLWVKLLGLEGRIRYGEYAFAGRQSIKNIIDTLVSGKVALHRLTIPEGYTIRQIAEKIESEGLGKAEDFTIMAYDPELLVRLGVPGNSLEGFCFPDTYLLPKDWPAERIVEKMVTRFWETFDRQLQQQAEDMGMTILEVVSLASIIQKESGVISEMPIISAVFHNRLKRNMRLMADPAVIYGLENFDGKLRKSDLKTPGPYNLYLNRGLPPGAISNPGLSSLMAALQPADVDHLFFVSKNNGTHYFSNNLAEHNKAVNKYQRAHN